MSNKTINQKGVMMQKTKDCDDFSNNLLLNILNKQQEYINGEICSDNDVESIFDEINRLTDENDERSMDEILQEAEALLQKQTFLGCDVNNKISGNKLLNLHKKCQDSINGNHVDNIVDEIENIDLNSVNKLNVKNITSVASLYSDEINADFKKLAKNCIPNPKRSTTHSTLNSIGATSSFLDSVSTPKKCSCEKTTNYSSKCYVTVGTSPIVDSVSIAKEYTLKTEIDCLQEKLKDTEERLQSLRIQHDSLAQLHRDLRESHTQLQDESEILKLDVQHLTECANILRNELQSAKKDRKEALDIKNILQNELEENIMEKKKIQEQCEKDAKIIQDLQRQCKEMERILMRKHPDSVSALIVASKNPAKEIKEPSTSRELLEQRIAQLEADAKEQDVKAQKILANVQARFNSVQSKYETHIADLETQVLSLQEINTKLNEKIEFQISVLNKIDNKNENLTTQCTQTEQEDNNIIIEEKQVKQNTSSTQTDSKLKILNSVKSNRQIPVKKVNPSKISTSHSDSTIAFNHAAAKEDTHLLTTIRGMRIDLAIKDKAMQRLTKELEECKKTIKKLQKEKEVSVRKTHELNQFVEQVSNSQASKEILNKMKLLEFDYKALQDKRLQDLKTLQIAHERELACCQETVHVLQQRLNEHDEDLATQKRRKVPIDYYALKAKVSSLERRHSEREQRLHMLVEALSKGRFNGDFEEILNDSIQ